MLIKKRTKLLHSKAAAKAVAAFVAQAEDVENGVQWLHSETLTSLKQITAQLQK